MPHFAINAIGRQILLNLFTDPMPFPTSASVMAANDVRLRALKSLTTKLARWV